MASHHLLIAIIGLITYHASLIFFYSFDSPVTARIHWMLNAAPFVSIIYMNAFIVCYPGNNNPRIARWLLFLQYLFAAPVMAWLIYHTWNSPAVFLFDGQTWDFAHPASSVNPIVPALACMLFLSILFLPLALWRIVQERGEERWWIAALLVLAIVTSAASVLIYMLSLQGYISKTTAYVMRTVFTTFTPYFFVVIYLSSTKDRTSSTGKLFGMSIAILSIVLMLSSYFALKDRDDTYDALMRKEARLAENGLASSPDIRYIAHYFPEKALLHSQDFGNGAGPDLAMHTNEYENTVIYEEIKGLLDRDFPNRLETILKQGGKFFSGYKQAIIAYAANLPPEARDKGQKVASYLDGLRTSLGRDYAQISRLPESNFREAVKAYLAGADERLRPFSEAMTSYMNLHSDEGGTLKEGVLHIVDKMEPAGVRNYRLGMDGRARYVAFLVHDARIGKLTEVCFSYQAYRQFVHEQAKNYIFLAAIILASCALGYPLIFSGMLVRPLLSLKQGVSRVAVWDLDTPLEVKNNDEFGDIACEFNLMISELKRYRDHLEEMVQERTEQLVIAKNQAEASSRAKSVFLASMSHELRTPLNAVLGYAQIFQQRSLNPEVVRGMATIQKSGEHLLMLINDILDIARIEAGKIEFMPVPIHLWSFLENIVGMVRSRAEVKGLSVFLEIEDELPESVAADETRLRQVLANLLSNAVKFTDAGSVVLRAKKPDVPGVGDKRASLRFEVEDTGIGIAPETMEKIFKPFEQAGDLIRRGEGVGLGLAISHQLVGMMGGKLQVKSDPGKGSLFWFDVDMPVADLQIEERVSENRTITGYPGTRRKILVVDDNASNREVIRVFLGQVGFEVIEAENGRQAVDMAQQMRPDLILMDRWMPEMNGTDAVKWIRHIPELSSLPVIAVSASVSERDQEQTLAAGFDAFLPKPVNWPRLAALLKEFLGLEWEYVEAVTPEREVSAKILIPPPREELAVLLSLARMGDMSAIMERAEHIRSLGEEFIPFAERLRALAERFEEQHILSLIRQYMEVTS